MRRYLAVIAPLCALLLVGAGCGSSTKKSSKTTTTPPKPASNNRQLSQPRAPQPASATGKPTAAVVAKGSVPSTSTTKRPALKGVEGKSVPDKLQLFSGDAGDFWQKVFTKANVKFSPATVNIVASPQSIACNPPGTVNPGDGPGYCVDDTSINLPVDFFTKLDDDPKFSDAGVLTLVGLQWAYHVENQLGLFKKQGMTGAKLAQGALCLDGNYVRNVGARGLLDRSDIDKIVNTVAAGGDAPGTPIDKGVGSPDDLVKAFVTGANGKQCPLS